MEYTPGARLSETARAQEFNVSRTPLRRVLARLKDEGLVQSVHGVGTFVTDIRNEDLDQTFALRIELFDLSERLFFQTTRIWLKPVTALVIDLTEEIRFHDREIDDILATLAIGDLHAAALIQQAHVSMIYRRMRQG